ncbi:MAG: hypothetical protein DRK00_11470 [Thermoprotei archaeon]|nr:MAG: hypothetical protein DRK00_11470 [Thermoprotei archaeon]
MSSDILDWFGSRRRERALKLIEKHMDEVLRVVMALERMARTWAEGGGGLEESFKEVKAFEKTADVIRRRTARLLAGGGELGAVERTLLLRLMGRVDRIADWALEAARVLRLLERHDVPMEVREVYLELSSKLVRITERTLRAVRLLHADPLKALEEADEVERLEEEVDALYAEDRGRLTDLAAALPAPLVVLLYDALNALENASDACEDTCDVLREVVVRLAW